MSAQRDDCILDTIRREGVRMAIAYFQAQKTSIHERAEEPEIKSPKVKYEVEEILNNAYMNRDEVPLAMDIFKPVTTEDKELPVIVVIHGGGLVMGDRKMARKYARSLASRGYLVFTVEYRLAPRANVCEQLDDVCAGLDLIGRRLVDFNVDFTRMFLTAESAGAYLAIYVAAMKRSERLQQAIGYEPTNMTFKALGLHSGMFYTDKEDLIGLMLADQFYGERMADEDFLQYLDPEHDEIIKNLPPVFLTTSRGDFLNNYTLMYHDALKDAGCTSHLVYYGDDELVHAFPAADPYKAASIDAIDKMVDWFEEQAREAKKAQRRLKAEQKELDKINKRLEDGSLIEQKSWKFIRELNSYSKERLDSVAIEDCSRKYTYRQLFAKWDSYAEVFSAIGITGDNNSRVAMVGTPAAEQISAFYALNMTGASVSIAALFDIPYFDSWKKMIEVEHITDIIVDDFIMDARTLRRLVKEQDRLGIRNIIVMGIPLKGEFVDEEQDLKHRRNRRRMKDISGVLFMEDLLKKYEAYPVAYSDEKDEAAVIVHSSGTVNGVHKPVPLSDRGLNEAVARLLRDERIGSLRGRARTLLTKDLSTSFAMIDNMHMPLAFGARTIALPACGIGMNAVRALQKYKPNVLLIAPPVLEFLMKLPIKMDFSRLEFVFLGGSFISEPAKEKYDRYLKKNGSKTGVSIGYGLSEAGAACILADADREDNAIGYPLPGVKVKIYSEADERYYGIEDGPRTGVMFISSPSVSCGRIDNTVLFELDEIDGETYLNTCDRVRVNEDGSLSYLGRMNKFFVNNEGIKFDAGLVETAVSAEPGIEACGLVAEYNKVIHDSVPVLYVQTDRSGRAARDTVGRTLKKVFIRDKIIKETNLPAQFVIAAELPFNDSGKTDVYRIMDEGVSGRRYAVIPVRRDGRLVDIRFEAAGSVMFDPEIGVPEELEEIVRKSSRAIARNNDILFK